MARGGEGCNGLVGAQIQPGLPHICDPVTIRANGTYVFKAGPVPATLNTNGIAIEFPPDIEKSFTFGVVGQWTITTTNGSPYLTATVKISNFKKPYVGLRCWFT